MISYYNGQLTDIMPGNITKKPEIRALSYALQQACRLLYQYSQRLYIYSNLDEQPEEIIDLLAAELRTQYYRSTLDLDTKRRLVKNTLIWYMSAGTPEAVEGLIAAVYGGGEVKEWYEYGDDPYCFRVILKSENDVEIHQGQNAEFHRMLDKVKRLSAHLDAIYYTFRYEVEQLITYDTSIRVVNSFYPRYNTPPFLLDGRARLDGTYYLNGYLSGETLDFYPVVLKMIVGADWRTGTAGTVGVRGCFQPWVQLRVETDVALRIWGAARAKTQLTSQLFFYGSANAETQTSSQLTMQGAAEEHIDAEASPQIIAGAEMAIAQESALQAEGFADCEVKTDGTLIVEKDLWRLDGSVMLDGSRILDAEIYEEKI